MKETEDIHKKEGGFLIDGKEFSIDFAIKYLTEKVKFTREEAIDYLKSLPKEKWSFK